MKNDKYIYNEKMERNDEKQSIKNEFFNACVSLKLMMYIRLLLDVYRFSRITCKVIL